MPDEIDRLQELELLEKESLARRIEKIEAGAPGECMECGDHKPRLVRGRCAPCRDDLGLP